MIREDLSNRLIHLTRDFEGISGKDRFLSILGSKKINGGERNGSRCVCFSEAPISSLGRIIASKNQQIRYSPYGFMFAKKYLFELGARPAIYQSKEEYNCLSEEIKYRHVTVDFSGESDVEYMWEREWRIKTDSLSISPEEVTLILPNRELEDKMKDENFEHNLSLNVAGIFYAARLDWHCIVLEDLGFDF